MHGVRSSPWPISRRTPGARQLGKREIPLSPIAIEIVRRIDAVFAIERSINGKSPDERLAVRHTLSRPLVDELVAYMRPQPDRLSRGHDLAKAINYMLKRWSAFTLFLDDGRVCMSNNAAERGPRGVGDGAFIVHLIFKCLETLEAAPETRSDTGALSGRWPW